MRNNGFPSDLADPNYAFSNHKDKNGNIEGQRQPSLSQRRSGEVNNDDKGHAPSEAVLISRDVMVENMILSQKRDCRKGPCTITGLTGH